MEHGALRVLEVVLVACSVVVFATLTGAIGAHLLERNREDRLRVAHATAVELGTAEGTPPT